MTHAPKYFWLVASPANHNLWETVARRFSWCSLKNDGGQFEYEPRNNGSDAQRGKWNATGSGMVMFGYMACRTPSTSACTW